MKRVLTQEKVKEDTRKVSGTKSRSQEVFDRLRSIYGLRYNNVGSQPLMVGPRINKLSPSPKKLTPTKLKLQIPSKSRTPQ